MRNKETTRIVQLIQLTAAASLSCAAAQAATLTGVVKQPSAPYDPAPHSVVTVLDAGDKQTIAGPDSFDTGNYTFDVPRGRKVLVKATWRPTQSLPGTTVTTVTAETTHADVQLQPPKGSEEARYFDAGAATARTGAPSTLASVNTLYAQEVPAASIYKFILGAKSESADAVEPFAKLDIFKYGDSVAISQGLNDVQLNWKTSGTVVSYSDLNKRLNGKVTKTQYAEMLGFVAPKDAATNLWWQSALKKSGATGEPPVDVLKSYKDTRILVYDPKPEYYN
jgi:hypothetical protein